MLTKSKFRNFLSCKNEFWLDHHFPEQSGELTLDQQLRREAGYQVERLARTLPIFADPDGTCVAFGKDFATESLFAKADIVVTDADTGEVDIYEVKSGTKAKEDYKTDLAFQCFVAEQSGYVVRNAYLIFINTHYLFDGEIDVVRLLTVSDETESVRALRPTIDAETASAIAWLEQGEPTVTLLDYCGAKLECRAIRRLFEDIPDYNVSHIFIANSKKLNSLLGDSILDIRSIPADFKMTDREAAIVEVERSGKAHIKRDAILEEITGLKYPLNFLDYESFNPAVPQFVGTRPYQHMVFQYSLHTIAGPGAEPRHSYHLSRNNGKHPSEEIVERLHEDLDGKIGTIVVWSERFETGRNAELATMYPRYAAFLEELNGKTYDLYEIFQKRLYLHPRFRGRASIKKVLPAVTDLTYDGMEIADGLTASIKWYHAATGRGRPEENEKTFQDLEAYCHLDTLAMARIYEHLLTI